MPDNASHFCEPSKSDHFHYYVIFFGSKSVIFCIGLNRTTFSYIMLQSEKRGLHSHRDHYHIKTKSFWKVLQDACSVLKLFYVYSLLMYLPFLCQDKRLLNFPPRGKVLKTLKKSRNRNIINEKNVRKLPNVIKLFQY
jgi:hypothetical protein